MRACHIISSLVSCICPSFQKITLLGKDAWCIDGMQRVTHQVRCVASLWEKKSMGYNEPAGRQKGISCKLHDLTREICISKAMEENLVFRVEEGCSLNTQVTVRHLAISSGWEGDQSEFESIVDLSRIRSLTVFGKWRPFYISDKMRLLRVLDLESTSGLVDHHLEFVAKLLHLKYLSLRGCKGIVHLPESLGNLKQLHYCRH